ncbi:MAG: recombinase [Ethanoligenens sp.]
MHHIPYGYRIENGNAVINEKAAEQVRTLFEAYLSGDSMNTAAGKAGIKTFHAEIGRMLANARYLGDGYYPAIIDPDTFAAAETERTRRAEKLGRVREPKEEKEAVYPAAFHMNEETQRFDDPFEQAEYAYSLIETEAEEDGCQ